MYWNCIKALDRETKSRRKREGSDDGELKKVKKRDQQSAQMVW